MAPEPVQAPCGGHVACHIDTTAKEARTDELTGLPNRRALLEELERRSNGNESFTLTLADLNGFKRYNDTFGHPAGDALLRRLGRKLATACEGRGTPARLGGDEFCVLLSGDRPADEAHALMKDALSEEGEGFRITSASGLAAVPEDHVTPARRCALRTPGCTRPRSASTPATSRRCPSALTRMLDEHHPGLGSHVKDVADLAVACAEALGLSADDVRLVERAAELHDLGKVGHPVGDPDQARVPQRRGMGVHAPPQHHRRAHPQRCPLAGARGAMVRSSHERWDGGGYPDRLAGEEIPIGARIIFVADAYCAMTEKRPYAPERSVESARQELARLLGNAVRPRRRQSLPLRARQSRVRADSRPQALARGLQPGYVLARSRRAEPLERGVRWRSAASRPERDEAVVHSLRRASG